MRPANTYRAARRNAARGSMWKPSWFRGKGRAPGNILRFKHGPVRPNVSRWHKAALWTIAKAIKNKLYR